MCRAARLYRRRNSDGLRCGGKHNIHCGGCMLTRTEILNRMGKAAAVGVPITNYGLAISECKGVLRRVLSPFQDALGACR